MQTATAAFMLALAIQPPADRPAIPQTIKATVGQLITIAPPAAPCAWYAPDWTPAQQHIDGKTGALILAAASEHVGERVVICATCDKDGKPKITPITVTVADRPAPPPDSALVRALQTAYDRDAALGNADDFASYRELCRRYPAELRAAYARKTVSTLGHAGRLFADAAKNVSGLQNTKEVVTQHLNDALPAAVFEGTKLTPALVASISRAYAEAAAAMGKVKTK